MKIVAPTGRIAVVGNKVGTNAPKKTITQFTRRGVSKDGTLFFSQQLMTK
jgi:hypothetical protein